MMRNVARLLGPLACLLLVTLTVVPAVAQPAIGGDARVNPDDFRITTFASGLNFPTGLVRLPDGSILVATSNPSGSYFNSTGSLLRFVDANGDGIADGPGTVVYSDPIGVLTAVQAAGNLVFLTSAKTGSERISILRMTGGPAGPYTLVGTLNFTFPANWEHKSYALAVRPAPSGAANTWELYFNVGSDSNDGQSAATVGLSGMLTATLNGGSIYRVTVQDTGSSVNVSNATQIASGLRNAAGIAFHPTTGDLYFEDNGIDGLDNAVEAFSADELNMIARGDLGAVVPNFGFPNDYIDSRTGQRVGSGGVQPLVAFLPTPDGFESEGPFGIAFAPAGFPPGLNNGVFVGFHGQFALPPSQNEENPVVYYDLATGQYFHFIEAFQLGHGDAFTTSDDSLFIADMSSTGDVSSAGTGKIYQIKRDTTPPQLTAWFTKPAANSPVSGVVPVGMSASGASGTPITFTLTVDGGQVFTVSGTATTAAFNWNTSGLATGPHTLGLTVKDGSGATATATRTVNVTTPLTASFFRPAPGEAVTGSYNVQMDATGAFDGPITFELSLDGTLLNSTFGGAASATYAWDTTVVAPGAHTLSLLVRDGVGRTATTSVTVNVTRCSSGQFFAQYFSNITLSGTPTRTACEAVINNDWGAGGPAGMPVDNFSVRWTGQFNFAGGSATFTARADDGIRVFLDGALIIDGWKDQPATTYTAARTVTAGLHEVKVEYYEKGGDAVAQVSWTGGTGLAPTGTTLTPSSTTAGGAAFTLTVDGTNFVAGTSVLWNGTSRATTFVSGTRVTAAIAAADVATAGSVPVSVKNPDGQTSNALTFTINPATTGCPTGQYFAQYYSNITLSGTPTRTACETAVNYDFGAGGPAGMPVDNFSVRWTGQFSFAAGSVTFTARADDGIRVFLDGTLIIDGWKDQPATTYTATRTVTAGTHEVKVEYYEKGGDAVAQVSWTGATAPPAPGLTTLTPNSATAGGAAFTLTADGTNFVSGATVLWNGAPRTTTFVSATRVTAAIPASDIAAAGGVPVTVKNPDGQTSNALTFTVNPAGGGCATGQFLAEYFSNITLTPPATRTACEAAVNYDFGAGGPAGMLVDNFSARWTGVFTFAGGNVTFTARADDGVRVFLDGALIIDGWKDQPATTYTATVAVTAGDHQVKVEYYEKGGDAVIQVSWTGAVTPPPGPTLTTLTPNTATAGGAAFTLTADGTNFVSGATVLWNGTTRTTTFVSATRVTASIPASDIAVAGSAAVSVRNPDGQTSGTQTFTITSGGGDTIKVFITAPANGATVSGTVWFTVWLENAAAGNRTLTLSVNGTTITSTTTASNGPISLPWSTTTADNGSRTATVTVRDSVNATGRASITLTVAN